MALSVTKSQVESLIKRAESARNSVKRARERADRQVGRVVQTVEVGSSAFTLGVVNGRWGGVEIVGVPLDLGLGGALHVLGFMGIAPEHMHNFADGALASFATTLGAGVGREMAAKAGTLPAAAGRLSMNDLQNLARHA